MRKLASLRTWLTAALPHLKQNPEALHIFAEEGRIACTGAGSLSFEYRYRVILQLWDFTGDGAAVIVPLLAWASRYQRELLQSYSKNPEAIAFRTEVLDGQKVDLELSMDLTEMVRVEPRPDGQGLAFEIIPEPFDDGEETRLWTLWLGDDQLAEWTGTREAMA